MLPLRWKIKLAKAALLWEAVWPALWPTLAVAGLFALAALTGIFELLPRAAHIAVLAAFCLAAGWLSRDLFRVKLPDDDTALRHLERRSGIAHRPASAYTDELASSADVQSETLWRAHKRKMAALMARLRPHWPQPRLMRRDPFALRAALLLALVAAIFLGHTNWRDSITQAVNPVDKSRQPVALEAWVSPPPYTGRAPIYLAGRGHVAQPDTDGVIEAPAGSLLVVRVNHARKPSLTTAKPSFMEVAKISGELKFGELSDDTREAKIPLRQSQTIRLNEADKALAQWTFKIIPDHAPRVELIEPVSKSANHALQFEFKLTDDYGATSAQAGIALAPGKDAQTRPVAPLKVKPPSFALTLPRARVKSLQQKKFRDLTAHPWAGLKVTMAITAKDEAGQTGRSNEVTFTLPERPFRDPLARAIIEQRRNLVHDTNDRFKIATALDALSVVAQDDAKGTGAFLGLRTTYYRLTRLSEMAELREVVATLWDIALAIEDGDLSLAERELRRAQEQLARALSNNAPDDEIKKLTDQLRQALNRYLRALAEQARRNPNQQRAQNPNQQTLSAMDLNKLLDRLEQMARSGAREAAQQLLAQLRNLLENLRAGVQRGRGQGQQSGMSRALNGLSGLINRQQQLMDKTFRQNNRQGQPGQQGNRGFQGEPLARNQEGIGRTLGDIMRQLGRMGVKPPSALGRAGEAMRDATGALRQNEGNQALSRQGRAIDQLRQGAQALAREMMQRMARSRNPGQRGTLRGDRLDPLGRPMRTTGPDFGDSTKVPSEIETQRAREIMRELQQRLGDRARPLLELDYIERLLRRF